MSLAPKCRERVGLVSQIGGKELGTEMKSGSSRKPRNEGRIEEDYHRQNVN